MDCSSEQNVMDATSNDNVNIMNSPENDYVNIEKNKNFSFHMDSTDVSTTMK